MSGSLFDDDGISAVPVGEFVPHHYVSIPTVQRLPPGDSGVRGQSRSGWQTTSPRRRSFSVCVTAGLPICCTPELRVADRWLMDRSNQSGTGDLLDGVSGDLVCLSRYGLVDAKDDGG